ncbi:MAG: VanZ family protein [Verrucomicrobiia bacterium]
MGEPVFGRWHWRAAFVVTLLIVLYLSLEPSLPSQVDNRFPRWFGRWSAFHDFVANAIAFGSLAYTGMMGFLPLSNPSSKGKRVAVLLGVGIVVFAAMLELVQAMLLPTRSCDWRDVVAACTGAGLAMAMYVSRFWKRAGK